MKIARFLFALFCIFCLFGCEKQPLEPSEFNQPEVTPTASVKHVTAIVIYAQDADDDYPFPDQDFRQRIFNRVHDYYDVMSYRRHQIEFAEVTNDGGYFKSTMISTDYWQQYQSDNELKRQFDGPFGIFNKEILDQVTATHGADIFKDADLIIMIGTDGGPGWYLPSINAGGYARLGFEFEVAGRLFPANYGGITIEIGSDFTQELYDEGILYWIFAHEYAHWLGFRKHRPANAGIYSLMTSRLYADSLFVVNRYGPNPLDPLLITRFGWLDRTDDNRVQVINASEKNIEVTLQQIRSETGIVLAQVRVPGTEVRDSEEEETNENFYIAYHRRDTNPFDACYPADGLLIWHTVYDNILDLECGVPFSEASERDHLDEGVDMQGLPTDFYNSENQLEFTPETHPSSNIWGLSNASLRGLPSGISITNIREHDGQITFTVRFDSELINDPTSPTGTIVPAELLNSGPPFENQHNLLPEILCTPVPETVGSEIR